ncbi:MAG: hypothetical protein K9G48_08655 [Reyranella sp.]|nr:hypothetical protein [Reyranella sp.]
MLSEHFSLAELTASQTAARRGIDNTPPPDVLAELQRTAQLLEKARTVLRSRPLLISSGYRSPALNAAVGGSPTSAHCFGMAADFTCPGFGAPLDVSRELATYAELLDFDQLIHEFGSWVHIGRRASPRRQLLTIDGAGTRHGLA